MIASEGEQKAARALMEAARVMASSPAALQLRCNNYSSLIEEEKKVFSFIRSLF